MHIRLRINNETNTYGISKSNTMKKLHVEMAMQSSLIITNHSFKEKKNNHSSIAIYDNKKKN